LGSLKYQPVPNQRAVKAAGDALSSCRPIQLGRPNARTAKIP
ncbi:unnamed protein product, partial [Urochloa humidicola]